MFDTVEVVTHARSPDRADLYADVARRVRVEVWHRDSTEMCRRHRHDWPDLWLAIDDLVTLLDGGPTGRATRLLRLRVLRLGELSVQPAP